MLFINLLQLLFDRNPVDLEKLIDTQAVISYIYPTQNDILINVIIHSTFEVAGKNSI